MTVVEAVLYYAQTGESIEIPGWKMVKVRNNAYAIQERITDKWIESRVVGYQDGEVWEDTFVKYPVKRCSCGKLFTENCHYCGGENVSSLSHN